MIIPNKIKVLGKFVKVIIKDGLHDQFGRLWKAKKFIKVTPEQFSEALIKGFSFITGSSISIST